MSIIKSNKISSEDTPITLNYLYGTDWFHWIIPIPGDNKYVSMKTSPHNYFRTEEVYVWDPTRRYYDYDDQETPITIRTYARSIGETFFERQTLKSQKDLIIFLDKVKEAVNNLQL